MTQTIVIALGGNAIKKADERGTVDEQFRNVTETCKRIMKIIKRGYKVILTHGNGPQAGNLLVQQEAAKEIVPPQPLDVVGAMTQGQIGYMIQQRLTEYLNKARLDIPVVTVLTRVLVKEDDPDFQDPSKPVGPFYIRQEAEKLANEKGYVIKKVKPGKGETYRRVVPSPDPLVIIEEEAIRRIFDKGIIVIACGGGGIPVVDRGNGCLRGIEAVIDKDLVGERLAEVVKAEIFLILTDIKRVKLNFGKANEKDIDKMSLDEAKSYLQKGHFLSGSMKPKILACIRFLEHGGEKAIISSLEKVGEALDGRSGTLIFKE